MRRMEIRCCCNPNKLIGYLTVPDAPARYINVIDIRNTMHALEIANVRFPNNFRTYEAIKSNDLPIEFFRSLRGFEENKHEMPKM